MDHSEQATRKLQPADRKDHHVRWALRVVGLLLMVASIFFLAHDLTGLTPAMVWVFGAGTLLGGAAAVTSWLPGPRRAMQRRPVAVPSNRS